MPLNSANVGLHSTHTVAYVTIGICDAWKTLKSFLSRGSATDPAGGADDAPQPPGQLGGEPLPFPTPRRSISKW